MNSELPGDIAAISAPRKNERRRAVRCVMSNFNELNVQNEDHLDNLSFKAEDRKKRIIIGAKILIIAALLIGFVILWRNLFFVEQALYSILGADRSEITIDAYIKGGDVYIDITELNENVIDQPGAWQTAIKTLFGYSDSEDVLYANNRLPNMVGNDWYLMYFRDTVCAVKMFGQKYMLLVSLERCDGKTVSCIYDPF